MLSVCFILLLVSGEVSSITVQESKNLVSTNSDESLQAVAEIPSDFNSWAMIFGTNTDILRDLPLVVLEPMFEEYLLAVFEFYMGML